MRRSGSSANSERRLARGARHMSVFKYIEAFYNSERTHKNLEYQTPDEVERNYNAALAAGPAACNGSGGYIYRPIRNTDCTGLTTTYLRTAKSKRKTVGRIARMVVRRNTAASFLLNSLCTWATKAAARQCRRVCGMA